ncbi:MAG: hypothetical protein RLZZ164_754 [Actinomycetota bacterium]|jgi:anthranilate synthase component 1
MQQVADLATTHKVIPLVESLFSTSETPLSVFEKLANGKPGSFLLESAEQGVWARYSFVGVNARGYLLQNPGEPISWCSSREHPALPTGEDLDTTSAIAAIEQVRSAWTSAPIPDLPPLVSGLVGAIGWDLIREFENLENAPKADFQAPIVCLAMFSEIVALDHHTGTLHLISNIFVENGCDLESSYKQASARIADLRSGLLKPHEPFLAQAPDTTILESKANTPKSEFLEAVEKAKEYVRIGDVFQVVISQRFDVEVSAKPLDIYRVLRSMNPSPYMYLLNLEDAAGEFAIVGASPEALVTVTGKHAVTHPIAGSRPRGANVDQDNDFGTSLQQDAKEKAEHLMLVDLARNDLLKVCKADSLKVSEFMQLHRYSHVMHLVSTVEGELRDDMSPVDAFKATFPAGTLSGAPKPRALEIIDELESSARGLYGGVVGYFDFSGNADLAIAIRTALVRDGVARIQAGAGLVLDSDPESEWQECLNKASAPIRAVNAANTLQTLNQGI